MSWLAATGRVQDSPLSWAPPALLLARVQRLLNAEPVVPFERERREQIIRVATIAYLDHVTLRLSRETELSPTPPLVAHGVLNTTNAVLRRDYENSAQRFRLLEAMTPWQIAQALIRVDGVRWADGGFVIDGAPGGLATDEPMPAGTLERSTVARVRSLSRAYDPFLTIRKAGTVCRLVQDLTTAPVMQPGAAVG